MSTKEEYKLIPMSEITKEARELAVAWMECDDKNWIGQKHKLASDIMNYARMYHDEILKGQRADTGIYHQDIVDAAIDYMDSIPEDKHSVRIINAYINGAEDYRNNRIQMRKENVRKSIKEHVRRQRKQNS
jgi:hypothetical protein